MNVFGNLESVSKFNEWCNNSWQVYATSVAQGSRRHLWVNLDGVLKVTYNSETLYIGRDKWVAFRCYNTISSSE